MNSLTIAGNIGRDAEIRALPDGTPVASFSVADSQGREKSAIWWNCQIFGKRAESLGPYLLKGGQVTVTGNVSERQWTDKAGMERKSLDVRVQDVALQGGKPPSQERERQSSQPTGAQPAKASSGFDDMPDDAPF